MKILKKIIKDNVLFFLIGAVLFGGTTYVVATGLASSNIDYVVANSNVETVKDALDDLYSKVPSGTTVCYNGTCGKLSYRYWNNNFAGSTGANLFDSTHMPATVYARRAVLEQNYNDFSDEPVYIRSVLIDGNVVGHEACFWEANNQKEFCIAPNYWAGTLGTNDATVGENTKIKLQRDMQNALGLESTDISCGSNASDAGCVVGDFGCDATSDGVVICSSNVTYGDCGVGDDGSASCDE